MDTATPDFRASAMSHVERRRFRRISYPFGVMLNRRGERFVDEGADFRNYTYAQYGAAVLEQPGAVAWQIFDAVGANLLYDDYFHKFATHWQAPRLVELIHQLPGIDRAQAVRALQAYNGSASGEGFDPAKGRLRHPRSQSTQKQLGNAYFGTSVSRISSHLRPYLHLRRTGGGCGWPGARRARSARSRPICGGRGGWRFIL